MKKIIVTLFLILIIMMNSSCLKRDDLEDIVIYTTVYPVEYLSKSLYGYNSEIKSVYPNGVKPAEYIITDKKLKDYAKDGGMLIYNGLSEEKKIAASFLNNDKNIKIIDVSQGLEVEYYNEELWLNPTNFLMMASNIRKGLKEYITNQYILEEIDINYNKLKEQISTLESEITLIAENSKNKVILTSSDMLLFLEKYGYEVVSLDEKNNELSNNTITKAKRLITEKTVSYIFVIDGETNSETVNTLIKDNTSLKTLMIKPLANLSTEERNNNENYITIMNNNIEAIRNEMYE